MKKIIPRKLLERVASKSLVKTSISEKESLNLRPYFYDDICRLEKIINKDLSSWK